MVSRKTKYFLIILLLGGLSYIGYSQYSKAKLDKPRSEVMVISHRGANDRMPEHTLSAYSQAIKDGADYIEIDLRMTKDHQLVAMHDETVDRTTNGKGKVSEKTLEEIKKLTIVYNGSEVIDKIPTLNEIFEQYGQKTKYYIELRDENDKPLMVEILYNLLKKNQLLLSEKIIIQSFSDKSLELSKKVMPDIPRTKLYKPRKFDTIEATTYDATYIGIEEKDLSTNVIQKLHKSKKKVHVYFINKKNPKKQQQELYSQGVDGFFTDFNQYTLGLIHKK